MCQEPHAWGHKCTKGEAHYIEVYPDSEPKYAIEQEGDIRDGGPQSMGGGPLTLPQGGGPLLPTWGVIESL